MTATESRTSYGVEVIEQKYQEMLDADTHPVPESYRRNNHIEPGFVQVPPSRYTSREFHDLEVEKVWKRAWQMAAHEDDMPDVGDYVPYDIAGSSYLIVRTEENTYKAYVNACLHRGRKLREARGKRADDLRCMFHGWCWETTGELKEIPCEWDYPYLVREEQSLPEVLVERWGRFIFINPDPDAGPLADFLGDLDSHFTVLPYEQRYKEAHVAKIIRCNWKVAQEAFMEGYHVVATHPQIVGGGVQDANTVYDVFGNYSRAITTGGLESQGLPEWAPMPPAEEGVERARHPLSGEVYQLRADGNVDVTAPDGSTGIFTPNGDWIEGDVAEANPHMCIWIGGRQLPEVDNTGFWGAQDKMGELLASGMSPRQIMSHFQREGLRPKIGDLADQVADIEFASVYFTVFPNFHPWGSFNRIVYRFRPHGNNPDECIMECIYLAPIPEDGNYPKGVPIHWLTADEDWVEADELGMLARVFNQDIRNLPYVQEGLHATVKESLQFAAYNESKPRHFHELLNEWIARD